MHSFLRIPLLAGAVVVTVHLSGCGKQPVTRGRVDDAMSRDSTVSRTDLPAATSVKQRQAELLTRIRAADPQKTTIERALLNEQNELGLILARQTNLDDVPKLARTMLAELDKTFPGQDHTVIAYTPTDPPRVIGTARLNARTRDMTYTPASPR